MLRPMHMRVLVGLLLPLALASACHSHVPPKSVAVSRSDGGIPGSRTGGYFAVVRAGHVLDLQVSGSRTCLPVPASVAPAGNQTVKVTLWDHYSSCTGDARLFTYRLALPQATRLDVPLVVELVRGGKTRQIPASLGSPSGPVAQVR